MSSFEKLVKKVLQGSATRYHDTEEILLKLGFELSIKGSHHIFRKEGHHRTISLKKRSQLIAYQLKTL